MKIKGSNRIQCAVRQGDAVYRTDIQAEAGFTRIEGLVLGVNNGQARVRFKQHEHDKLQRYGGSREITLPVTALEIRRCGLRIGDKVVMIHDGPGGESLQRSETHDIDITIDGIATVHLIEKEWINGAYVSGKQESLGTDFDYIQAIYDNGYETGYLHSGDWERVDEV